MKFLGRVGEESEETTFKPEVVLRASDPTWSYMFEGPKYDFLSKKSEKVTFFSKITYIFYVSRDLAKFEISEDSKELTVHQPFGTLTPQTLQLLNEKLNDNLKRALTEVMVALLVAGDKNLSPPENWEEQFDEICVYLSCSNQDPSSYYTFYDKRNQQFVEETCHKIIDLLKLTPNYLSQFERPQYRFMFRKFSTLSSFSNIKWLKKISPRTQELFSLDLENGEKLEINPNTEPLEVLEAVSNLNREQLQDLVKLILIHKVGSKGASDEEYEGVLHKLQDHGYLDGETENRVRFDREEKVKVITEEMLRYLENFPLEKRIREVPEPEDIRVYSGTTPSFLELGTASRISEQKIIREGLQGSSRDERAYSGTTPSRFDDEGTESRKSLEKIVFRDFEEEPTDVLKVTGEVLLKDGNIKFSASPGKSGYFSLSYTDVIKVFRLAGTPHHLADIPVEKTRFAFSPRVFWHPEEPLLVFISHQKRLKFWSLNNGFEGLTHLKALDKVWKVLWSPLGDLVLVEFIGTSIEVYRVADGALIQRLETDFSASCTWISNEKYSVLDTSGKFLRVVEIGFKELSEVQTTIDVFHPDSLSHISWNSQETAVICKASEVVLCGFADGRDTIELKPPEDPEFLLKLKSADWLPRKSSVLAIYQCIEKEDNAVVQIFLRFWDVETEESRDIELSYSSVYIREHFLFLELELLVLQDSANYLHFVSLENAEEALECQLPNLALGAFQSGDSTITFACRNADSSVMTFHAVDLSEYGFKI